MELQVEQPQRDVGPAGPGVACRNRAYRRQPGLLQEGLGSPLGQGVPDRPDHPPDPVSGAAMGDDDPAEDGHAHRRPASDRPGGNSNASRARTVEARSGSMAGHPSAAVAEGARPRASRGISNRTRQVRRGSPNRRSPDRSLRVR